MNRNACRRGQPLIAFGGLLTFWFAIRVVATTVSAGAEAPATEPHIGDHVLLAKAGGGAVARPDTVRPQARFEPEWTAPQTVPGALAPILRAPTAPPRPTASMAPPPPSFVTGQAAPVDPVPVPPLGAKPNPTLAGGHQLLFLAAFSQLPLPDGISPVAPAPRQTERAKPSRWSGDGWLLMRRGGGAPALAAIGGSYGASQAGMLLRYRLDTTSAHRPSLYLRASTALNGVREQEAALGLAARPLAGVPVLAMGELRAVRSATGTRLRPAAALVTQLAPFQLPLRLTGEAYGQAGWVGGNGASAFVDGQLRAERKLARLGSGELAAGGASWGGAQKGASRLDAGPTLRLTLHPTEQSTLRVAADWRFRLAGHAAPQSGPALTLSAGF